MPLNLGLTAVLQHGLPAGNLETTVHAPDGG
jgi:hypothetical protein